MRITVQLQNFAIRPEDTLDKLANREIEDHWHFGGYQDSAYSGVAGWDDYGAISSAARETLKQTAGISPPSSGFVVKDAGDLSRHPGPVELAFLSG